MKKKFFARLLASTLRTIGAAAILLTGICLGYCAWNWQAWCQDTEKAFLHIAMMYAGAIVAILIGIYLISPIFWIKAYKALDRMIFCDEEYYLEDEEEEWEEDERRRVRRLRKKYIW